MQFDTASICAVWYSLCTLHFVFSTSATLFSHSCVLYLSSFLFVLLMIHLNSSVTCYTKRLRVIYFLISAVKLDSVHADYMQLWIFVHINLGKPKFLIQMTSFPAEPVRGRIQISPLGGGGNNSWNWRNCPGGGSDPIFIYIVFHLNYLFISLELFWKEVIFVKLDEFIESREHVCICICSVSVTVERLLLMYCTHYK